MEASSKSKLLPDDILAAVFALAETEHGGSRLAFRGHDYDLQRIFSQLRDISPELRSKFVYSDAGPVPYSPVLNESISRLQLSGLIGRENPDYEVVFLRPAAKSYFDNVLKEELSGDTVEELTAVAKEFLKRVSVCH